MIEGLLKRAVLLVAALFLLAGAPAVASSTFAPGSTCLAADPDNAGFAALARDRSLWSCNRGDWSWAPERAVMRFDLAGRNMTGIDMLTMRINGFERLTLTLEDMHGNRSSTTYGTEDLQLATYDWLMSARLPSVAGAPSVLWLEVDEPRDTDMLTDTRFASSKDVDAGLIDLELLVAALCGVMVIPFIYNIAFYRVLRERFLLFHAAVVACLITHIFVSSGLINRFVDLSVKEAGALSVVSWTLGIVAAGNFIVTLVEEGKLDPWHRRLVHVLSALIIVGVLFFLFADGPLRPWTTPVFVTMFFPVLGLFALMMATALRRGSRAIRFQIFAWTPIMSLGVVRATSNLGAFGSPMDMMVAQHLAIAFEVAVTSLGVADRFMTIKRQRDRALAESRVLEREVERDELTGLLNRRGIGQRFDRLFAAGFDTMALVDLDHFKRINDSSGHAVGDEVLRSAAEALMTDENTLAVRMGGEEFLLLLRGSNAVIRAEHRRRAITTRVAAQVPGLGFPVTASMGLVSQPRNSSASSDFATLYTHCDRLLYEAKRAGRNRTMSERIMRFDSNAMVLEATADESALAV